MGSGHSLALGLPDDACPAVPSQINSMIDSSQRTEFGSQTTNTTLQRPRRSLYDVTPEVNTQTNLVSEHHLDVSMKRQEASQSKVLTGMGDESSAPVRNDLEVPDFVSQIVEQSQVADPETRAMTKKCENLRAAIRKDLQSGRFEIPPLAVQNIKARTHNLAGYQFPPAILPSSLPSRQRQRFDRSALLPDSNLPFCAQIMEHVKDWAEWGTRIADDQRREEVLDHVFAVLSKAWFEALRLGYNPGTTGTRRMAPQGPVKRSAHHEEIPAGLPRGRPRSKRETSPSKKPILVASHRDGPAWAITVGELEEAGISEGQIRRRAAAKDTLEVGDKFLDEVLNKYHGKIQTTDWFRIMDITYLNPTGRDLMIYCLYEVLRIRSNIEQLWKYYNSFTTPRQKNNTKRRIDDEQERHNLFMALALELNEGKSSAGDPTASNITTSQEGPVVVPRTTAANETVQPNQFDTLVQLIETILDGTDIASINSSFEFFEISQHDLVTDVFIEETSNSLSRCKHILKDLLFLAREWLRLSKNAEPPIELDTNVDLRAQVQNAELEILERKILLGNLLPSLIVEREVTRKTDNGSSASTKVHSPVSSNPVPTNDKSVAEAASPAPSKNIVKHHLDLDDGEAALPPAKRQKPHHEEDQLDSPLSTLGDGHVNCNLQESGKSNIENKLDVSGARPSSTASKETCRNLLVRLRVPSHFKPMDFTSKRVFSHPKGFKYRYTNESTLTQRRSMTEDLETYVRFSMTKGKNHGPDLRFGKYHAFTDHWGGKETIVIHGIWDLENGNQPEGFKWFYKGDGTRSSDQKEVSPPQDVEVEEVLATPPPSKKSVVLKLKNGIRLKKESDSCSTTGDAHGTAINSQSKDKTGPRDKNKNKGQNRYVRFTAEPPAVAHPDYKEPASISRPKRKAAARKSYVDNDDDYVPSE
ncbi:uncharacterized protein Z519_01240 [Cladophialophora bantiana CBS 173.52]|uniref:Uncharacterized protein n=1 Tax=Cladophialophora bantiana (strain ATCC 10958 / CBS 173.52 / CDC B-1940 / NIH 8579) TaxID=1442370 RepID=A0A0D2F630_CLAB1|nr:uncharacterized protein Z519_01240 [Cladophialophora bantiana CBS 173.52]KIW97656.1 hypothetical protein Z519_01240 [Cladophialophora bantiana CBS 173.52]